LKNLEIRMSLSIDMVKKIQKTFYSEITLESMKEPFFVTVFDREGKAHEKVYCRDDLRKRFALAPKRISRVEARQRIKECERQLLALEPRTKELEGQLKKISDDLDWQIMLNQYMDPRWKDETRIAGLQRNKAGLEKSFCEIRAEYEGLTRALTQMTSWDQDYLPVTILDSENDQIDIPAEILNQGEDATKVKRILFAAAYRDIQRDAIKDSKGVVEAEMIEFFTDYYTIVKKLPADKKARAEKLVDVEKLKADTKLLDEYEQYEKALADKKVLGDNKKQAKPKPTKSVSKTEPQLLNPGVSQELLNVLRMLMTSDPAKLKTLKDEQEKRLKTKTEEQVKRKREIYRLEAAQRLKYISIANSHWRKFAKSAPAADVKMLGDHPNGGSGKLLLGRADARPLAAGRGAAMAAAGVNAAAGWAPAAPDPKEHFNPMYLARPPVPRPAAGVAAAAQPAAGVAAAARPKAPPPAPKPAVSAPKRAVDPAAPKAKPQSKVRF
jgi:hypothetical protein